MTKVPLVTYENGERKVIGEAEVDIKDGDLVVQGHVTSRDHAARLYDEDMTGFSIFPQGPEAALVSWRKPLNTENMFEATADKGISVVVPAKLRRRLPNLDDVHPLMVANQPYTAADLPMLDKVHETLGVLPEWLASERRATIARLTQS